MGGNANVPNYCNFEEISVRCNTLGCTIPLDAKTQIDLTRRHNRRVIRWNNVVLNLASRNAGGPTLMNLENELRPVDQSRFTTDGIQFDTINSN